MKTCDCFDLWHRRQGAQQGAAIMLGTPLKTVDKTTP